MISLISQPADITLVQNPVYFEFEVVHALLPANHRVKIRISIEREYGSGEYELLDIELKETVNAANRAVYDISSVLKSEFNREMTIPTFGTVQPYIADNRRRYKIMYTESFGETPADQPWMELDPLIAFWGGMDQQDFADFDFFASLSEYNGFLSYTPSCKKVSPKQPEYLFWYNYTDSDQSVLLELKRWREDGEDPTVFVGDPSLIVAAGEVVVLPAGMDQLNGYVDDVHVHYELRVIEASTRANPTYFSQKKYYQVDPNGYDELYYLHYLNTFGLPETLRCIGGLRKDLAVDRSISSSALQKGYKQSATTLEQYAASWENLYVFRTGWLSDQQVDALQEMLIINKVFLLTDRGYYSMLIESNKFKIHESYAFLNALEFQCIRALEAKHYSNDMIAFSVEANIQPTPDQGDAIDFPVNPNDLASTDGLLETDDLLIIRDGVLQLVTPDDVVTYLVDKISSIKKYKSIRGAKADAVAPGEAFLAADPNLMGVPPGTLIFIPKEEIVE